MKKKIVKDYRYRKMENIHNPKILEENISETITSYGGRLRQKCQIYTDEQIKKCRNTILMQNKNETQPYS